MACAPLHRPTLAALALVMALAVPTWAATVHVAPWGDDEAGGDEEAPFQTIQRAVRDLGPGDTCWVRAGVYREAVTFDAQGTLEAPVRLVAAPGEAVVITGADLLTAWARADDLDAAYTTPWPHSFIGWNETHAHPGDGEHAMIGRAEQVHVNGLPLLQVLRKDQLSRGTFYADLDAQQLFLCARDGGDVAEGAGRGRYRIEASVRQTPLVVTGMHAEVRGIIVRYAANMAQHGAAAIQGNHVLLSDCVFERANSMGLQFSGEDITVRRCTIQYNGQQGFGASYAHRLRLEGCTVRGNNTKDWQRGWEAGGNKICLSRDTVFEGCTFIENRGNGIWFDIGNENCTVRNCLIMANEDAGIFYEISFGLHAHDSVIIGNGHGSTWGSWGANGGIALSSSPGCVIERNILIGNREGIQLREQRRSTPHIDGDGDHAVWNHDETVARNIIAYSSDVQVGGWFDVGDARHWPRDLQAEMGGAEDQAQPADGQPAALSLEGLNLTLDGNVYAVRPGQSLWLWGCRWRPHMVMDDLESVRDRLGFEQAGMVVDPGFADPAALDLRIPAASPLWEMGVYPEGDVPGVLLGRLE